MTRCTIRCALALVAGVGLSACVGTTAPPRGVVLHQAALPGVPIRMRAAVPAAPALRPRPTRTAEGWKRGRRFPGIVLNRPGRMPADLHGLRGEVVLLSFWASWCAECRPEMPMLERLHQDFAAQGLTVLGVNFREETSIIQRYAKTLGLTFPLVLDPQGEISRSYGVIGLPTTFLVGRDGRPVALAVGPRVWESQEARALMQVLLAESVAKKDVQ